MPWFRVDDDFYDHPKVQQLEEGPAFSEAICLWLLAGTWCSKFLTEGLVPRARVRKFGVSLRAASELVRVGLWDLVEDGFQYRDWQDYQPSKEEVETQRKANRERQKRFRGRRRDSSLTVVSNALRNGQVAPSVTQPPFPIPYQEREISDPPTPNCSPSPRAHRAGNGGVSEGQEPDTNDPLPAWTQERMGRVFQREWQAARNVVPSLHAGRNPLAMRELYESSVETAAGRGVYPEALFVQTLRAWIPTVGKSHSPFAFFAASWTGLLSTDPNEAQREAEKKLREDVENQLRAVRAGAHNASR